MTSVEPLSTTMTSGAGVAAEASDPRQAWTWSWPLYVTTIAVTRLATGCRAAAMAPAVHLAAIRRPCIKTILESPCHRPRPRP